MKRRDMAPLPPAAMQSPLPVAEPEAMMPATPLPGFDAMAATVQPQQPSQPAPAAREADEQSLPRSLPLPQGGAMRKVAMDLLYENVRERAALADKDHVGAPPLPPRRPWRERRPGRLLAQDNMEDGAQEVAGEDWLVLVPADMPAAGGGVAQIAGGRGKSGSGGARARLPGFAGFGACSDEAEPEQGERLHRVAVVADNFIEPLRPPRMARPGSLPALRPKSRAECERRCGSDGFCDPSDPLGCGGMHCGQR